MQGGVGTRLWCSGYCPFLSRVTHAEVGLRVWALGHRVEVPAEFGPHLFMVHGHSGPALCPLVGICGPGTFAGLGSLQLSLSMMGFFISSNFHAKGVTVSPCPKHLELTLGDFRLKPCMEAWWPLHVGSLGGCLWQPSATGTHILVGHIPIGPLSK